MKMSLASLPKSGITAKLNAEALVHFYLCNYIMMSRGGGTDFSLGGRVSEAMTWRAVTKLGGSGGMLPQEDF